MQKFSVAIVGYGNIGKACKRAVEEAKDIILAGVIRRPATVGKEELDLQNTQVVVDIRQLKIKPDVVLLCIPSWEVSEKSKFYRDLGFSTVDALDELADFKDYKIQADLQAKANKSVSLIACGWEPGTDSAIRALMKIICVTGRTTSTFGGEKGGRSMGQTAWVKSLDGVKNALVLTKAIARGKQKRHIYLELEPEQNLKNLEKQIKQSPLFSKADLEIETVPNVAPFNTLHHEVEIERTGVNINQRYQLEGINPEFTANIMLASVRACWAAKAKKEFGAFSFIERPLIDYLPKEELS